MTNLRLASALAPVNQPLRFEVSVANFGPDELPDVAVSLAVDADAPSDEQTLPPLAPGGEPKTLSLFATFREPGFHTVTARIHGDRCPFDDTRTFAVRVVEEVNVLLVDGEPGSEPRDSEVFYLRNALTPVPEEMRDRYYIKTKTVAAADLEQLTLRDYEAVVLANVVDLSGPALNALENYVRLGGGLIVFPGSRISPAFYNAELHRTRPLLPAAFGPIRGEPIDETKTERPDKYFRLQGKDYTHRIVELWKDSKNGTLASAQFYRAYTLQPAPAGDAPGVAGPPAVVLAFADGPPAVMERTYGHGRVVQFASTADTAWCDLPVRPVFLPLMHRTLGALLARQEEQLNVRTGTMFSHIVDQLHVGHEVTIVEPGAKKETTRPHLLELKNNLPLLEYSGTALGGRYDVFFAEDDHDKLCFAAAPDPKESDLHEFPASDWQSLSDVVPVSYWTPSVDLRSMLQRERTGTELWSVLAIAALLLAAAETLLGNRWSRSR